MDNCIFCKKPLENGTSTVKLKKEECDTINKFSSDRQQEISTVPGLTVHNDCRRDYINPKSTRWKGGDVDQDTCYRERDLSPANRFLKSKKTAYSVVKLQRTTKEKEDMTLFVSELLNSSIRLKVHAEREMTNGEKKF